MNIVCAGYRSWAYSIFNNLIREQKAKSWNVSSVLTVREQEVPFCKLGVNTVVIEPLDSEYNGLENFIATEKPTCILFFGWSWIIPKTILDKTLCIALHPSPLPKYRGGSPIQNQILAGEVESAISLFLMTENLDDGDILGQKNISLAGNLTDILDRIINIGGVMTCETLDQIASGNLNRVPQDHSKATFVRRRKPSDSEITIDEITSRPGRYIYDKIRCLQDPYPNAFIRCADGTKLFLIKAKLENGN
jgi:methionyl-tRNA formyltransferase